MLHIFNTMQIIRFSFVFPSSCPPPPQKKKARIYRLFWLFSHDGAGDEEKSKVCGVNMVFTFYSVCTKHHGWYCLANCPCVCNACKHKYSFLLFFFVFVSFLEMHTFFFSNLLPPSEWLCDICQCLCFTLVEHFCHIINICKKNK